MRALLLVAALIAPTLAMGAEVLGTVTILEGQALILRGNGRVHAAEGVRLEPGDIVETAPATFAQVELADRAVAQLGPETRLLINATTGREKSERWLYLLDGWIKLASAHRDSAAGPGFDLRSPTFELPAAAAVLVLHSTPAELKLFVEAGETRIAERQQGAPVACAGSSRPDAG
jgi:FecR protein